MVRKLLLFALLLCALTCAFGQCNAAGTMVYLTTYTLRTSADWVYSYSQTWAVGPDAPYDYVFTYQDDYFNDVPVGTQIIGSAAPGGTATASRNISVDFWRFGNYRTSTLHATYDACTGVTMPPYLFGIINGITSSNIWVYEPTITGPARLWLHSYGDGYPSNVTWYSNPGGAPETPIWNFADTSQLWVGCTVCSSVSLMPKSTANPSCSTATTAYYTVGNLRSPEIGIMINGAVQVSAENPDSPHQHVVNVGSSGSIPGSGGKPGRRYAGYDSYWYWQLQDKCGLPMEGAQMHESFPQGFQYDPANSTSNWTFFSGNQWNAGVQGIWRDDIYYNCVWTFGSTPVNCTPLVQVPQSPLTTNIIFAGLQNIYAGNTIVDDSNQVLFTGTQAHFIDHGGYK